MVLPSKLSKVCFSLKFLIDAPASFSHDRFKSSRTRDFFVFRKWRTASSIHFCGYCSKSIWFLALKSLSPHWLSWHFTMFRTWLRLFFFGTISQSLKCLLKYIIDNQKKFHTLLQFHYLRLFCGVSTFWWGELEPNYFHPKQSQCFYDVLLFTPHSSFT